MLLAKKSPNIGNHPYKLLVWIYSNCDHAIERFLDIEITREIKKWLQCRGLSENILVFFDFVVSPSFPWSAHLQNKIQETMLDILEIIEQRLKEERRVSILPFVHICVDWLLITRENWRRMKRIKKRVDTSETTKRLRARAKNVFDMVLTKSSKLIDPQPYDLEIFYWTALSLGIVEKKHMMQMYRKVCDKPMFPSMRWYVQGAIDVRNILTKMLWSKRTEVIRLAAISLGAISERSEQYHSRFHLGKITELRVADKFWELANDEKDKWRPKYIEGLACCALGWETRYKEWIVAIKEAKADRLQQAWRTVIESAGYREDKDARALFKLLLHILESKEIFAECIRYSALNRLYGIISRIEPTELDERTLNLPLSRRATLCLS